jgi:hypothetical protein
VDLKIRTILSGTILYSFPVLIFTRGTNGRNRWPQYHGCQELLSCQVEEHVEHETVEQQHVAEEQQPMVQHQPVVQHQWPGGLLDINVLTRYHEHVA